MQGTFDMEKIRRQKPLGFESRRDPKRDKDRKKTYDKQRANKRQEY